MNNKKVKTQSQPRLQAQARPQSGIFIIPLFMLIVLSFAAAAFMRNGIYKTPVHMWANAVIRSPDKQRTHENYGQALSTAGYYNEALREFKTVLALKDDGSVPKRDVYRELGVVYFRINLIDESIMAWQKGLSFAPFDAGILNNLSIALMRKGRYDEALSHAEMARGSDQYMAAPVNTMGEIYMMRGEYEKSVAYFQMALEREPYVAARHWNLALAYDKLGKFDAAYQHAARFLEMEQDPRYRYQAVQLVNQLQQKMMRK